jgi:YHS domain-containing protein
MRAALDQAQKPLAEMKQHMSMCMNMMGMMQKMHGMGGMMGSGMGGMMADKDAPRMATSPEQLDPVCQMKVDPKTAPQTTYKGTTYYFCSEADKATFLKNPEAYIKK